jgi:hypothetical protein
MPTEAQDIAAVERVVDAVYAAISGPAGQERDWAAMRALYLPEARLTAIRAEGIESCSLEEYIASKRDFLVTNGFAEGTMVNRVLVYGGIAHAWSSYTGGWTEPDGTKGGTRGINSFQLMRQSDGSWRVLSLLWQVEQPDIPLPAAMESPR